MHYLLNKIFSWKYIISGLVLCWLIVGLPKLTEVATWGVVVLVAFGSFKLSQQKLGSLLYSVPATIILTLIICINTRLFAIYQDLTFASEIWVSKQYDEGNLNVVTENSDLSFVKRPYDFPQFKPDANHSLIGHYNREVRKHTPIVREYVPFQGENPRNNKSFIHLTENKEGLATIKISEVQKLGVHHLTYSLYSPTNELLAKATYQVRVGFPFENYWQGRFQLNDRKVSSLGYLLHKNALSTYLGSFVPEQNEKPLEKFLDVALASKKPYWIRRAKKLAKEQSQDMYILSKKEILNETKLEKPVTLTEGNQKEVNNKLTSIIDKHSLVLSSCRDLLRDHPEIFDKSDIGDRNIIRRLSSPIEKLNLLVGRFFFCTEDSFITTALRSYYRFERPISIKTVKNDQEKVYYLAIKGEKYQIENSAIPLYNTLNFNESQITLTWAVTDSEPKEENSWHSGGGDIEAGLRKWKHSYNLPMLPLEADLPIPINVKKLVTIRYYN
jgi:hypothetical protein